MTEKSWISSVSFVQSVMTQVHQDCFCNQCIIDQLKRLIRFNNWGNNMYYFVNDLKNYYASAKAAGWKFPMGTASLIHLLKTDNPNADNNQAR